MIDSPRSVDPRLIEAAHAADILAVAQRAGARLKRVTTTEWAGPCPECGRTDTFAVNTSRRLFVCRFGQVGGDAIALARHALGLDFAEAVEFVTGETSRDARTTPAPPKQTDADDEKRRIEYAREIWLASLDPRGTLAETYLNGRALQLDADIAVAVLRFNPRCPWKEGKDEPTIFVPAMIAAMRSIASDEITAIQRTRLSPDGRKLDRRMLGIAVAAAIKLDPDDAVTHGLHIGEGAETCMSARHLGLRPAWALGSKGQIAKFPVVGGVGALTILAEPDAEAQVQQCGQRWHDAEREVLINRAIGGKDLNDVLRGAA
jgi:hypothetical protein